MPKDKRVNSRFTEIFYSFFVFVLLALQLHIICSIKSTFTPNVPRVPIGMKAGRAVTAPLSVQIWRWGQSLCSTS